MEANAKDNIEVPLITLVIGPNYVKALQLPEVFATKSGGAYILQTLGMVNCRTFV